MKNRTWLWFPAIQGAALVMTASGTMWTDVVLSVALAWLLLRLPRPDRLPEWMRQVQGLWNGVLAGQVLSWFGICWPEFGMWPAIGLVILALWQTGKGANAVQAQASVLAIFQAVLIGGVLAAGVRNGKPGNLGMEIPGGNGWLITALLLPAIGRKEERNALGPGLWALGISVITQAVVPAGATPAQSNAFWEMSRSITVFGKIRRLESLAAVGLSLGFYILLLYLLGGGERRVRGINLLPVLGGFLTISAKGEIPGIWAMGVSILLWIILPLFAGGNSEK